MKVRHIMGAIAVVAGLIASVMHLERSADQSATTWIPLSVDVRTGGDPTIVGIACHASPTAPGDVEARPDWPADSDYTARIAGGPIVTDVLTFTSWSRITGRWLSWEQRQKLLVSVKYDDGTIRNFDAPIPDLRARRELTVTVPPRENHDRQRREPEP